MSEAKRRGCSRLFRRLSAAAYPISLPGPSDMMRFLRDERTETSANFPPCF